MVLIPTPGLEFGCFRNAYRGIRYVDQRPSASKQAPIVVSILCAPRPRRRIRRTGPTNLDHIQSAGSVAGESVGRFGERVRRTKGQQNRRQSGKATALLWVTTYSELYLPILPRR